MANIDREGVAFADGGAPVRRRVSEDRDDSKNADGADGTDGPVGPDGTDKASHGPGSARNWRIRHPLWAMLLRSLIRGSCIAGFIYVSFYYFCTVHYTLVARLF